MALECCNNRSRTPTEVPRKKATQISVSRNRSIAILFFERFRFGTFRNNKTLIVN